MSPTNSRAWASRWIASTRSLPKPVPIWQNTDPVDGKWNLYTAGWLSPGLTRDEKNSFQQMYAPNSQQSLPVFLANTQIDPEFQKVCR